MSFSENLKTKKVRHSEYYDVIEVFDKLYDDSKNNRVFNNLMEIITSDENIKLAYRNIKRNGGSTTRGVDNLTIKDIENSTESKYVHTIKRKLTWYKPKPVRRVEIPKADGRKRPLGIPTIWDRLIQQCILQVLEPICEAKFHERNNGFRPNRSTENAIAQCYRMIQIQNLHFVVDIDIKGFFDNVNHSKLIKQIWSIGIRDKKLICIIKEMLKTSVILPNGEMEDPSKGTPQGGILSPLLSNIVLSELDWWISSQWETNPIREKYPSYQNRNGGYNYGNGYMMMKKTNLKEMYIVRYADDFKIFCKKRSDANKISFATKVWLNERLKLQINEEKSKVINLKKGYSEFLGFKMKASPKNKKYVVKSQISDKAKKRIVSELKEQIKYIQNPKNGNEEAVAINIYNSKVIGIHNYYKIATDISLNCSNIAHQVNTTMENRINNRLKRRGTCKGYIKNQYASSKQIRYVSSLPICPISYVQTRFPRYKKRNVCKYTSTGREEIHKKLGVNMDILHRLMRNVEIHRSIEYMDNRISLYTAQQGKCLITRKILDYHEIHCHHQIPIKLGGSDKYQNLIIIHADVHKLIHAISKENIYKHIELIQPDKAMLNKINKYRAMVQLEPIEL